VENSLCKWLWTCPTADCEIMKVSYARMNARNQPAIMLMEVVWLIFRYFPSICLAVMRKTGKMCH
jgi:hypothetical protein